LTPISEPDYVNIYARDITKEREAQQEAQRRQNELIHVSRLSTMGEMATGIAHELNQPLSAIVNFANGGLRRLKHGVGGQDDQEHALEQIAGQAKRAGEIIKRMRGLVSRQLVNEVCALLAHETRKLDVVVERRLSPETLLVRVDAVQIEQVMLNLLRNALDALSELPSSERRLAISSGGLVPDGVYVAVHDNGPGIRPQVMERLFDPFFTTKKLGMGMGLAITQTIVAEHNGKIRADSWPGKGTTFTLELPVAMRSAKSLAS
jgi:C4-dicarboxylate-specific signal transduction histidine kinase